VHIKFILLWGGEKKVAYTFMKILHLKYFNICYALSGLAFIFFITQGVALCWNVSPFQGLVKIDS